LGMKKKGFGEGWWNGFGGKVEEGEELIEAAKREVQEEVGLKIKDPEERGVIHFHFEGDPTVIEVHVFSANEFEGDPEESEEMKPEWFDKDKIPYDKMWPADRDWLPIFFEGKKFTGEVHFSAKKEVLSCEIHEATEAGPNAIEKEK